MNIFRYLNSVMHNNNRSRIIIKFINYKHRKIYEYECINTDLIFYFIFCNKNCFLHFKLLRVNVF